MTDSLGIGVPTGTPKIWRRRLWFVAGAVWMIGVVVGLSSIAAYDNRPGTPATARSRWPTDTRLDLDPSRPTLVLIAHPRCDCSRASLAELAELLARARHRPRTYIAFVKPGGVPERWEQTSLWQMATALPDAAIVRDDDGSEARRFGATTSGQTFLYAPDGALLYSGGLTGARGHVGNNAGRSILLRLLNQTPVERHAASVFGCSLFDEHNETSIVPERDIVDETKK